MPNSIGPTGLVLNTRQELFDYYSQLYRDIYGEDINLEQSTPDGQMMNIQIQAVLDLQDLLMQIYNTFDPDNAIGRILDQRVAINGIQRQAGTFTVTNITVVVSQSVTLFGIDQAAQDPYRIADNEGNEWVLQESTSLLPGTHVLSFQSAVPGEVLTVPNTITVPKTIVLGVVSVNNPTTYTVLGINEESDYQLKIRRQQSVSLSGQGYLASLLAALLNISGVTFARVYENNTGITDGDGIPGHSIWVIVAGSGLPGAIANAIYTKRNAGCGMKGGQVYNIPQADGTDFPVRWDDVEAETLFIFFTATSLDGVNAPDIVAIKAGLPTEFAPGVYEQVNINDLATAVQNIDNNTLVTNAGFSNGKTQTIEFDGTPASGTWKVVYNGNASAAIDWNDGISTIEGKIQAIPGLSSADVSGSYGAGIVVDLSSLSAVEGLLVIEDNSLQTSAPADISITVDFDLTPVLTPSAKNKQFAVMDSNIVITPILITPIDPEVNSLDTVEFSSQGGYGEISWSIPVNISGATIDPSTGEYEAGAAPGTDTVRATDSLGNYSETDVVVS